jgi:predicted transcriptional regulator
MSDVLAFTKAGSLLLTGLTNPQVVRTAEMADIVAICFTRGKKPDEGTIRLAKSKGLPLLTTRLPMFESCGRLYKSGVVGCSEYEG